MKTLIVYATTYGFTKDCVEQLVKKLDGEVVCINAMKQTIPDFDGFDAVIVGGSIYMGKIQKEIRQFCEENAPALATKKLGLFLACGLVENLEQNMQSAFPSALLENACVKSYFGGELRLEKMSFLHKTMCKMMTKSNAQSGKEAPKAMPENIAAFADGMNAAR